VHSHHHGRSTFARRARGDYGVEQAPGDIDVSPSVYCEPNTDEYPRKMTWKFVRCPDAGHLCFEFRTEANPWWMSLWVRNPRVPIRTVEVESANHTDFFELRRESDGRLNDDSGFGEGAFTLRITAIDGQVLTEQLDSFTPGELVESFQQFK
jgi:expansin